MLHILGPMSSLGIHEQAFAIVHLHLNMFQSMGYNARVTIEYFGNMPTDTKKSVRPPNSKRSAASLDASGKEGYNPWKKSLHSVGIRRLSTWLESKRRNCQGV